jgi:uncharacterized membrane protein YhaH (DUF805 family)
MNYFQVMFSFKGRIGRLQYWMGAIATLVILVIGFVISGEAVSQAFQNAKSEGAELTQAQKEALGPIVIPFVLALFLSVYCSAALYVKRLHDRNKGAMWLLAIYGPAVCSLVFPPLVVLSLLSNLWVFIELGCMPGTKGPNRFDDGPSSAYLDDAFGKAPKTKNQGGAQPSLGGMEAAMSAINAAARAAPSVAPQSAYRAAAQSPQFGGAAPQGFGRKNVAPSSGGFGRRGL